MIFCLLLSLLTTGSSGSSTSPDKNVGTFVDERQQRVIQTFDRVTTEISKEYVTSKGMPFPARIKKITELEAFLAKVYPDEGHELRQAVLNLHRYRDLADADAPISEYLRKGLDRFAVDLNGKPFAYDRQKIAEIIEAATGEARNQLREETTVKNEDRVRPVKGPITGSDQATSFVKRHAVFLTTILLAANAISLIALILMWGQRKSATMPDTRPAPDAEKKSITHESPESLKQPQDEAAAAAAATVSEPIPTAHTPHPSPVESQLAADDESAATDLSVPDIGNEKWLVVKASVPGKLHTDSNPPIPCQDSCFYRSLGEGWGVAVVCDGAGSKELSQHGAKFVANKAGQYFGDYITGDGLQATGQLPSHDVWHKQAQTVFRNIKTELDLMAREKYGADSNLLSCTVIVVIHTPFGVLTSHVGDGRAAFCNADHEWKAVMKPHKGEEANQTVFITALDAAKPDCYVESTVVPESPVAFALMSDGCESHSFEVNIRDESEEKYSDPNRPYPRFFQPLVSTLRTLHESNTPKAEIDQQWKRFIESGTARLATESDDKTMILGVLLD